MRLARKGTRIGNDTRGHSLGSFEIQLDPGKSGYWMVLIPLRPEDVDQPALALRNMALRGSDNEASQDPWGRK